MPGASVIKRSGSTTFSGFGRGRPQLLLKASPYYFFSACFHIFLLHPHSRRHHQKQVGEEGDIGKEMASYHFSWESSG